MLVKLCIGQKGASLLRLQSHTVTSFCYKFTSVKSVREFLSRFNEKNKKIDEIFTKNFESVKKCRCVENVSKS
jgi:hypothetical protein